MAQLHPRVARIVEALEHEPGLTVSDLADRAGLPARHVAMLLWRMEDERLVVHEANRWFAVETG